MESSQPFANLASFRVTQHTHQIRVLQTPCQLELRYFAKVDNINLPSWIPNTIFQFQEC
uniref:Uncharacterized protein n=1 Tax=Solanum tuberosum TaxID=4113 RepID=M0ZX06_SOLTU